MSIVLSAIMSVLKLVLPLLWKARHDKATFAPIDKQLVDDVNSRIDAARNAGMLPPVGFRPSGNSTNDG